MSKRTELKDSELEQVTGGGWVSGFQAMPELDANTAFRGTTPAEAYLVRTEAETTVQASRTSTLRGSQSMK